MPQWRAARQAPQEGRDQAEADQGAGGGNVRARREDQALSRTRPAGEGIAPNSTQRVDNESGTPDKTGSRFRISGTTSRACRQVDGEGSARARSAVHLNRSAMRFHDPPADVEAQPEPAVMAAGHGALEPVEDAQQVLGCDADPMVADDQLKPGRVALERDVDRLSGAELDGVGEEVGDDLIQSRTVGAANEKRGKVDP